MKELEGIKGIFLVGIGGIGMSALARYFLARGYMVAGYDRTMTKLTGSLEKEGCSITYEDNPGNIPQEFQSRKKTLVIFTPAIPAVNRILVHFRNGGFMIRKRSEILGGISEEKKTIAIAGTHGKTSVTTLSAYLLKQSVVDCTAFLGGISKNYNSNLFLGRGDWAVMEADEYDRSFLRLKPYIAVITSIDPDHLEIYGDYEHLVAAFNEFASKVPAGGRLLVNYRVMEKITGQRDGIFTYGLDEKAGFTVQNIKRINSAYNFDIKTPFGIIDGLTSNIKGRSNLENILCAVSAAILAGVSEEEIRKALPGFSGVVRRFDVRVENDKVVYIDDYAHHPEELNFCIASIREFYHDRNITGIFQPHLFSRTRDYADEFADSLDKFDSVILLPVYPAREEPIDGVDSEMIFNKMKLREKCMMDGRELLRKLPSMEIDVLVTIGAGDIDMLVKPIEEILNKRSI